MSSRNKGNSSNVKTAAVNRRNVLLAGSSLAAASAIAAGRPGADGAGASATVGAVWQEAEHPRHLRRRHRPIQHQRLLVRPDGLPHAEHRSHRARRHDVHRLLRRAELHGGPVLLHHWADRSSAPASPRSAFRAPPSACRRETSPSPRRSSRSAMPPASSARTISATATNTCRPCTASTSSSATSITSMPRKSRKTRTTRRIRRSRPSSAARRAAMQGHRP